MCPVRCPATMLPVNRASTSHLRPQLSGPRLSSTLGEYLVMVPHIWVQVHQIVLFSHPHFPRPHLCHGRNEGSELSWKVVWWFPLPKPCHLHPHDHVCYGPHAILPQHVLMVDHLEYHLFHCSLLYTWSFNLDSLEGYLCPITQVHICKDSCNLWPRSSVQA